LYSCLVASRIITHGCRIGEAGRHAVARYNRIQTNGEEFQLNRLQAVERNTLPPEQRRFHDAVKAIRRRPITGPFIVLMNSSPDLAARFAHLGHYFHSRGQADESMLSMRVRGFASLIGSHALNAPYEWSAWVNWAIEAGVPQDTVDAIREGRKPQNLTAEEELIADFCGQLISGNHRVSDTTFKAALAHFGAQGIVELVVTLGYFAMIALPLNAFEIQMSPDQKTIRKPFTPLAIWGTPWSAADPARAGLPPIAAAVTAPARLPLLSGHDDVAPAHQHFLDRVILTRGWIAGAFQILLHTPDVAARVANIGAFFLYETILPAKIRSLAWLITARELDCNYAWQAATAAARAAGVDAALITGIENDRRPGGLSDADNTLFDFCYQLLRGNHHIDDATYQRAVGHFGVPATVQIAASVGYIVMLGVLVNAFEVAPVSEEDRPLL
jgi:4-carboxymuconolactone decarboxylase